MRRAPRSASTSSGLPITDLPTHRRLQRQSSGDLVADHIRRLIFDGVLHKGDHLRQDDVARELGVSRIPVREAVIALDREGWLTIEPHRGAFVHGFDEESVRDHYEVFGLIYGLTARRATERGTPEGVGELAARHKSLKAQQLPDGFWEANNHYLRQLFAMADSHRLASLSRLLRNIVPGNFFEVVPGAMATQKRALAGITRAIAAGDAATAEAGFQTLMRRQGGYVVALLAQRLLVRPAG